MQIVVLTLIDRKFPDEAVQDKTHASEAKLKTAKPRPVIRALTVA